MNSTARMRGEKRVIYGQPSWRLAATEVEAFVTETGGHLGPVTFERKGRKVRPYSVAPWTEEAVKVSMPPIIRVLRGDFFCLPFGGNAGAFRGEKHPVHGETANARWRFRSLETRAGRSCLHLSLRTKTRPGQVDKRIWVVDGQNVVYSQHVVSGMSGPMNLGHHAILRFPDTPGSGRLSTSGFAFGQVFPGELERPEQGGYSWLKPGAAFDSLEKVPTLDGGMADLTRYPARRGFEELVMLVSEATAPFAWTAVAFPRERYVWFALKDPRVLRETIFWLSNGGRHYPPWSGRHVNVMGLEEVTSYFHYGLAESARRNPISERGFPTCLALDARRPLVVPYIMGVARIPAGFDRVAAIRAVQGNRAIRLESRSGRQVEAAVELDFLQGGAGW
ncbi:MAG TPA: hypothetical protein P5205_20770 [Candidatus Paceibacterota bacterium]|nr:hypothetical protein [Verrucomicrobiota bacterium]HSA12797.1 hypothetical protein [Candidatus Paceibacterota bacterium]